MDSLQKNTQYNTGCAEALCGTCPNTAHSGAEAACFADAFISDFTAPLFRKAFRQYFAELCITVESWDEIFREMNDGKTFAFVRTDAADGGIIGFLLFSPISFSSWFFEQTCGFIREFWVAEARRGGGHGTALLHLAEQYFTAQGWSVSILTTDTAAEFYRKNGYALLPDCRAKNEEEVFARRLDANGAKRHCVVVR